ncbi:hypothetical protein Dvar_12030 [Desulfosarcina variabilis str. Montpellier]|uniref:prolipoprotein diacylglyceryl transferase family protein n=1 Tax=Desulfosarcina variabilis TaxID=2300 RepID=UPI003AFA87F8
MANWLFVAALALFLAPVYLWSFKSLPGERWQILCSVPIHKDGNGAWEGLNLTYYGFFNALALCAGVALVFILTASAGIDFKVFAATIIIVLGICLPASRAIARWVEKKPHTFSVGAASFLGIVAGPWLVLLVASIARKWLGIQIETMAVVSALIIGYTLGEGVGRLACVSFGCCYGRPIDQMHPLVKRYFSWVTFTYIGQTKKIAYAHQLDGEKIFAVQAVTVVLYTLCALMATLLYLYGAYAWAFFLCLFVTQAWRFASEFLRADYRGKRKISVYQLMSLLTIPYGLMMPVVFPSTGPIANVLAGLQSLWDPSVILFLQVLGLVMFFRTGRSQTTGAGIRFHVNQDRI